MMNDISQEFNNSIGIEVKIYGWLRGMARRPRIKGHGSAVPQRFNG